MKRTYEKDLRGQYLLNAMEEMTMNGDAYVSSDQLYRFAKRNHKALTYDQFRTDRAFLLKEGFLRLEGSRLYQKNIWEYENSAAKALAEILAHNDLGEVFLPEKLTVLDIQLTEEQREAAKLALSHRLSIILGGAGSGKTTLIRALAEHRPVKSFGVVVCAPTGKAACNLTDRTGLRARTVHSSLGKIPDDDFLVEKINWSYTDLVVIDEARMLTLEMLAGILAVIHPACHVVLVGDPNQLLSVGPGNVLPDLLSLDVAHIRLGSYHRQSDADSALAYNVREFGACRSLDDLHFDDSFRFIPLARLRLAYVITIHKAQGSEYDTIVLPISKGFANMLHRNLLYTAISRARKRVVIVGDPDALNMALRCEAQPRRSMLVSKTHSAQEFAA